jgi:predicted Zn-dependent protease
MPIRFLRLFFLVACPAIHVSAWAHGPIHEQIEEVTRHIQREPRNAELYLKRAELYRIHREWDSASSDYQKARNLDPKLETVDFLAGRMLLESEKFEQARILLDRYLSKHPDEPEPLLVRARVKAALGKNRESAEDYTRAIARYPEPRPDHYIERARALAAAGDRGVEEAIAGLDEGIQKLGPTITLELLAIDLQVKVKRYDAALSRLDSILARSPRKETWLVRKAEILAQAGRKQEAREEFARALSALESLPPQYRSTRAMAELEKRCKTAIAGGLQ